MIDRNSLRPDNIWKRYRWLIPHHPERPWWTERGSVDGVPAEQCWIRSDGHPTSSGMDGIIMADRDYPLHPPPPAVGQVWAIGAVERPIVRVEKIPGGWNVAFVDLEIPSWPPPGAALVAGTGSPWAPPGWTEQSKEVTP